MDVHHLLLCVAVSLCMVKVSYQDPNENRLIRELLKDYNPLVRPVKNHSDPLTVKLGLNLIQIMDLDEKKQILTTNVWLNMMWTDSSLQWDSKEYNGIKDVRFSSSHVWKPDILLYNSGIEGFDGTYDTYVLVKENGECVKIPPGIFKSVCKVDVRWFPFDVQTCKIKLGSWTYNGALVELKLQDLFLGDYTENNEWDLVATSGKMNTKYYICCPEPYSDITYTLVLRRRSLFYSINLIIPCILLSTLAVMAFLLPVDSGAKISLGVTVVLCFTILLWMVTEVIPVTSESVPLIAQYFIATMVIVGLSVIASVVVLRLHHHDSRGQKMPKWARDFLLKWCAWLLHMRNPADCGQVEQADEDVNLISKGEGTVEPEVGKILEEVRFITKHLRAKEATGNVYSEWKFAAAVLDRLFLVVFSILIILLTLGILLSAPGVGTADLES